MAQMSFKTLRGCAINAGLKSRNTTKDFEADFKEEICKTKGIELNSKVETYIFLRK